MARAVSGGFHIRQATAADSSGIVAIWQKVAAERIYSAIDQPWTVEQQHAYLSSRSPREATHVAVDESGRVIGFQSLDLWASTIASMQHVAEIGTHLLPEWRRRGVGRALFAAIRSTVLREPGIPCVRPIAPPGAERSCRRDSAATPPPR